MPEWKALNVGVESEDVAQDQKLKSVRVFNVRVFNVRVFNVFEVSICV